MYDIKDKTSRFMIMFFSIFLIIGLLFAFILGIFIAKPYYNYYSYNGKAIANRTNLNFDGEMYTPSFEYEVNGKTYYCKSKLSSNIRPKDKIIIKYELNNPNKCITSYETVGTWFDLIFLIFPLPFIAVGGIGICSIIKNIIKLKRLNKNGMLIKGLKYEIENSNIIVNGKDLMCAVIKYNSQEGELTLKSKPLENLKENDRIDLVIDPNNLKNYYIDFDINYK